MFILNRNDDERRVDLIRVDDASDKDDFNGGMDWNIRYCVRESEYKLFICLWLYYCIYEYIYIIFIYALE